MKRKFSGSLVTMGIGLVIFILGAVKDALDKRSEEEYIEELIDDRINRRLGEEPKDEEEES